MLDRVGQEIRGDLPDTLSVSNDHQRFRGRTEFEDVARRLCREHHHTVVHKVGEIERRQSQREVPGVDLLKVEKIVDQRLSLSASPRIVCVYRVRVASSRSRCSSNSAKPTTPASGVLNARMTPPATARCNASASVGDCTRRDPSPDPRVTALARNADEKEVGLCTFASSGSPT
jgi:hypothetical protein